jgi:putative tricarboxylic transport membrane protein
VDSVKKTKRTLDRVGALFWFVLALVICYRAASLGVGSASEPGPGFIFFWSGVTMAFLALLVFADSLRVGSEDGPKFIGINWPKVLLVLAALLLYGLLLERFGFVVTTFALMCFLLWISDVTKWPTVLAVAGGAALGSFALFDLWLKIRLPKGIFGI